MSETTKEVMLIQVNSTANNNKFYHVTLANGVITKRWGRVDTAGSSSTEYGNEASFDRIVKGKIRRGYKETGVVGTITKPATTGGTNLLEVAKKVLATSETDAALNTLVEKLVQANRHQILESSDGLIKVDTSGHITTPLGVVSLESIEEARTILQKINNPQNAPVSLVENYLQLIPQRVPHSRGWGPTFFANPETSIDKQQVLLSQLEDSVKWYETEQKTLKEAAKEKTDEDIATKYANLFEYKISVLTDDAKFKEINALYQKTLKRGHQAANLKLQKVYVLESPVADARYTDLASRLGNERVFWHGTNPANVLSILRQGLVMPKSNYFSMFGPGIYLSDTSTKSLNYSNGYWGGGYSRNCFMFLTDTIMGNTFKPTTVQQQKDLSARRINLKGYDSINVPAGKCGVVNHEAIVLSPGQVRLRYLCEFN